MSMKPSRHPFLTRILSVGLLTLAILCAVGMQPRSVAGMTEATYYSEVRYVPEEDGWVWEEGCRPPAGGCYIVTA